jgi:hypothetical protein
LPALATISLKALEKPLISGLLNARLWVLTYQNMNFGMIF